MLFPRKRLRQYQKKVVDDIRDENAIVKMPTGSGKTFVAAEFISRGLRKIKGTTNRKAALFLAPTCDLVTQQKKALEEWVEDCIVADYFGGKAVPTATFDVLVSTPQAFLTVQQTNQEGRDLSWSNFFSVIFDECHHVLKDHPYRIIAHDIKAWEAAHPQQRIQIVGLSASLTYAVEYKAVEQALANLCHDLNVTKMISPAEEELRNAGYIPREEGIETMKQPWGVPDDVIPEHERRPHMMHAQFMDRVNNKKATKFASQIYQVVCCIESDVNECGKHHDIEPFKSPLEKIKLSAWEEYAYKMKCRSVQGSAMQALFHFLEVWYVALRMVVQSWEEEEKLVLQWLMINGGFHKEGWFSSHLDSSLNSVVRLCTCQSIHSDKLQSLTTNLVEKRKQKGITFRGIVFVQQRISAYVLSQYLNKNSRCIDHGLRAGYVAARNSRITPSIKVRPGEASRCIDDFRRGSINLIVATSVIEEGFDVPQANV